MPIKRVPPGTPAPSVADLDLMGPLGLPVAGMAAVKRLSRLTPDDMDLVNRLLGKPIRIGKRLLMLSSGKPDEDLAIVHDATSQTRHTVPLRDFLSLFRQHGEETADAFTDVSLPGRKIDTATTFGPRGGVVTRKRR